MRKSRSVEETPDHTVVANLKKQKKESYPAMRCSMRRSAAKANVDELNLAAGGLEAECARDAYPGSMKITRPSKPHVYAVGRRHRLPPASARFFHGTRGASPPPRAFGMPDKFQPARIIPTGIILYHSRKSSFIGKDGGAASPREGVPYEVGMAFFFFFREIARGQIRGDTTRPPENSFSIPPTQGHYWACTSLVKEPRSCCTSGRRFFSALKRHGGIFRGHRFSIIRRWRTFASVIKPPPSMV